MGSIILGTVLVLAQPPGPPPTVVYFDPCCSVFCVAGDAICGTARVVVAVPVETGRFAVRGVGRTVELGGDVVGAGGRFVSGVGRDLKDGGRRLRLTVGGYLR